MKLKTLATLGISAFFLLIVTSQEVQAYTITSQWDGSTVSTGGVSRQYTYLGRGYDFVDLRTIAIKVSTNQPGGTPYDDMSIAICSGAYTGCNLYTSTSTVTLPQGQSDAPIYFEFDSYSYDPDIGITENRNANIYPISATTTQYIYLYSNSNGTGEYTGKNNSPTTTDGYGNYKYTDCSGETSCPTLATYLLSAVGTATEESNYDTQCDTCTRIVTPDPYYDDVLSATTTHYVSETTYYVSQNDNPVFGTTYVEMRFVNFETQEGQTFTEEVTSYDEIRSFVNDITILTTPGSYTVSLEIYNDTWWLPRDSKYYVGWNFDVISATPSSTVSTIVDRIIEGGSYYGSGSTTGQTVVEQYVRDYLWSPISSRIVTMLQMPPFGYVYHFLSLIVDPATSTIPSITIGFAPGSPSEGLSLELNPMTGITTALANIEAVDVTTIDGSPMAKFLSYWNLLWYLLFAFWVVREILGGFEIGITTNKEGREHIKEINMKKQKSGTINVTKG